MAYFTAYDELEGLMRERLGRECLYVPSCRLVSTWRSGTGARRAAGS